MALRSLPCVLVTGTPGTGKTSLCELVAERTGLRHVRVGDIVKEKGLHAGRDAELDTFLIDEASEDKICDELEDTMSAGGVLLEHHSVAFFPERWFDLVLVLQSDNTVLFDRLTKRGYSSAKVSENVECEIMQVVAEEARECYRPEIVHICTSDTLEDLEANAARVTLWLDAWRRDNAGGAAARAQ